MDYRYYGCRYFNSYSPRYHEEIKIKYVSQSPWFGGGRPSPPKTNNASMMGYYYKDYYDYY